MYWWEERGETPFLKPYGYSAKEFLYEVMIPLKNDPNRVQLTDEKLPFEAINTIDVELTDTGKQIIIATKDGRKITATNNFPKNLKKDPNAGIVDNKIYALGILHQGGKSTEFKLAFDFVKQIKITALQER
jgi:predicted RNA-binding protein YlqC (UPF0109 family)